MKGSGRKEETEGEVEVRNTEWVEEEEMEEEMECWLNRYGCIKQRHAAEREELTREGDVEEGEGVEGGG